MPFWRSNWPAVVVIALSSVVVSRARLPLNATFQTTRARSDVFTLPPSNQLVVMSLGYRSALADLIFAHVLVSSGIHFHEKRAFDLASNYLDAVIALDPKFEAPYRMADGLITLQAKAVSVDAYRQARRILERGMAEFPYSQALWASAGQFLAYLGPTGEIAGQELQDWKLAGGRALARACELVGSNEPPPNQCIVAAGLLTKAGETAAARQFVERMLLLNQDPRVREVMNALLEKAVSADERERMRLRREAFQREWAQDLPFASRGALLTIGPSWDSALCASPNAHCSTSWRAWAATLDRR